MSALNGFDVSEVADMFAYLDDLRVSGETNMFGAGSYLAAEYTLDRREAGKVLSAWIETFGGESAEVRAAKAIGQ